MKSVFSILLYSISIEDTCGNSFKNLFKKSMRWSPLPASSNEMSLFIVIAFLDNSESTSLEELILELVKDEADLASSSILSSECIWNLATAPS